MPDRLKLVAIDWLDSKGAVGEWEYRDELQPLVPSRCTTVGFLLEQTRDYMTLAPTISDEQVIGRITIPKCSVLKQRTLR